MLQCPENIKQITKEEKGKRKGGIRINYVSLDRSELVNNESISQVKYLLIEMQGCLMNVDIKSRRGSQFLKKSINHSYSNIIKMCAGGPALFLKRFAVLRKEYINVELSDRTCPHSINLKEMERHETMMLHLKC